MISGRKLGFDPQKCNAKRPESPHAFAVYDVPIRHVYEVAQLSENAASGYSEEFV